MRPSASVTASSGEHGRCIVDPITRGDRGPAVEDIQARLEKLGFDIGPGGADGVFGDKTAEAVSRFREREGLEAMALVDDACWSALVDATFELGDRSLFLRYPYFHGADVACIQGALNVLGFSCGEVDGIFGAHTEKALREFQSNVGIEPDGIAGSLSFSAIMRLSAVWRDKDSAPAITSLLGFARVAGMLEMVEACMFGTDPVTCGIASKTANLARATTAESKVTSADSLEGIPSQSMLLVQIALDGFDDAPGIPHVAIGDESTLAARLVTAIHSSSTTPRRILVEVDDSRFVDIGNPTLREEQHVAVVLLDALCEAWEVVLGLGD